jgi:hypothetical protein
MYKDKKYTMADLCRIREYNNNTILINMPLEIISYILEYLDIPSLIKLSMTCTSFADISQSEWEQRAKAACDDINLYNPQYYKNICIRNYKMFNVYTYYTVTVRQKGSNGNIRDFNMKKHWVSMDSEIDIPINTFGTHSLQFPYNPTELIPIVQGPKHSAYLRVRGFKYIVTKIY